MLQESIELGRPLQIVTLDMAEKKVTVNEEDLASLTKSLRETGVSQVAVVSVMGAFRTGKSFLLDLFLRYLRHDEKVRASGAEADEAMPPARAEGVQFPLPDWITSAGGTLEGASDDCSAGFRFKGGMDRCTQGIWVWSEPFVRRIDGKDVALLLMDTQGAWDSQMTKEQSATIFGLTAVLSSKQIYNISMQIQEDKVENLTYFMEFAQAALRAASNDLNSNSAQKPETLQRINSEASRPFQSLEFLVRDWKHFEDEFTMEQCHEQMQDHMSRHLDPAKVAENSTVTALNNMFHKISCFCLPHPGRKIEKETWTGAVKDIDSDFLRFIDSYVKNVFKTGLEVKSILGTELSTMSFAPILRNFVEAFHSSAPAAMTFTQAMTNCTILLAKEGAMKNYQQKMDKFVASNNRGSDPEVFQAKHDSLVKDLGEEFNKATIFGNQDVVAEAWTELQGNIQRMHARYVEENKRRLERALVSLANIALVGLALFLLDWLSNWVCDWWLPVCYEMSKLAMAAYVLIFGYLGFQVWRLWKDRGQLAAMMAGGELWKEMIRLLGLYGDVAKNTNCADFPAVLKRIVSGESAVPDTNASGNQALSFLHLQFRLPALAWGTPPHKTNNQ